VGGQLLFRGFKHAVRQLRGGTFNCSNSRTGVGIISEGGGKAGVSIDGHYVQTPN